VFNEEEKAAVDFEMLRANVDLSLKQSFWKAWKGSRQWVLKLF